MSGECVPLGLLLVASLSSPLLWVSKQLVHLFGAVVDNDFENKVELAETPCQAPLRRQVRKRKDPEVAMQVLMAPPTKKASTAQDPYGRVWVEVFALVFWCCTWPGPALVVCLCYPHIIAWWLCSIMIASCLIS